MGSAVLLGAMRQNELRIETPCGMDYDAMIADPKTAKKRFCGECKKHVHDLSKMTKPEARALLAAPATEGLCIRYLYDAQGDVVFADRLVPTSALTRAKRFVTAAAALALPLSLNACMGAYAGPREKAPTPQVEPAVNEMPVAADAGAAPATSTPVAK